jgi:hypothetical protein
MHSLDAANHFGHRESDGIVVDLFLDRGDADDRFRSLRCLEARPLIRLPPGVGLRVCGGAATLLEQVVDRHRASGECRSAGADDRRVKPAMERVSDAHRLAARAWDLILCD